MTRKDALHFRAGKLPTLTPRALLRLPAARIRELAEAGATYPGSGITATALLDRERRLYRRPVFQPPQPDRAVMFPSYQPAPGRTVYGVEHTPTNFAALAPPYYGPESPHAPWMSETEETAWTSRDAVYPSRPRGARGENAKWRSNFGPSFADDSYGTDSLSGLYDVLIGDPIQFWTEKWNDARTKLSAALVSMAGTSQKLATIRAGVNAAIDRSSGDTSLSPDDLAKLEAVRQKLVALEANQSDLEGRAREAGSEMQSIATNNADSGLGVFPIVAVGVVIATVIGIVAAVVVHTQNVNALASQLALVASGQLSTQQVRDLEAGSPSLPGLPNLAALGSTARNVAMLGAVGLVAWFLLKRK